VGGDDNHGRRSTYCLYNPKLNGVGDEPPEWGWTDDDGAIFLRLEPGQPWANVVRHEMGHLLGVGRHHGKEEPPCVMHWDCSSGHFCADCITIIRQTCQVVDA